MKRTAIGFIAILLLITILGGCLGGDSTAPPAPPSTLPAIQSEIATLKAQVSTLSSTVSTLSAQVSQSTVAVDTTPLEISIATLDSQIVTLTERLAILESGSGVVIDEDGTITVPTTPTNWGVIRWRPDVQIECTLLRANMEWTGAPLEEPGTGAIPQLTANEEDAIRDNIGAMIQGVDPRTIKEEDLYDIELCVENRNVNWAVELTDIVFTFMLRPDDYAYLDENMTYLDSDSSPYLDWESSFVVREREGEDVTRRVEFESEELDSLKVESDSTERLDLVLELYYG